MEVILTFIQEHPYEFIGAFLALYEIFARYIPTEGNWSLVHNFARFADLVMKNRSVETNAVLKTTTEVVIEESKDVNNEG